ncbi:hypothetical protein BC629DRAFT_1288256, partial [Irpex lacteus]
GKIVPTGLNLGPRHGRILGHAKSFTKNLNETDLVDQDNEVISAASLTWHFFRIYLPSDVIPAIDEGLNTTKMLRISTRHIGPAGIGFSIRLGDKQIVVPLESCAPPECYTTEAAIRLGDKQIVVPLESCAPPECYTTREVHINCSLFYG